MKLFTDKRPSPALLVAVAALTFALAGTAIAADPVGKLTRAKVRKIANQEIDKRAPGLAVLSAKTADSAKKADHATTADSATTATNATNATNATTATNATNLGGSPPSRYEETAFQNAASATISLSTSFTSPTTLNTLVLPGPSAYLIQFDGSVFSNTTGVCDARIELWRDGAQIGTFQDVGAETSAGPTVFEEGVYSQQSLVNVPGASATFTVVGSRFSGAGDCIAYSRILTALQIDNATGAFAAPEGRNTGPPE